MAPLGGTAVCGQRGSGLHGEKTASKELEKATAIAPLQPGSGSGDTGALQGEIVSLLVWRDPPGVAPTSAGSTAGSSRWCDSPRRRHICHKRGLAHPQLGGLLVCLDLDNQVSDGEGNSRILAEHSTPSPGSPAVSGPVGCLSIPVGISARNPGFFLSWKLVSL